ncbi:MAG: tRNA 2-thiouridine(34) synthase MnmA, partial [Sphingopyxis sp.]|nr:tRNA 2-thiouridine(34) synthase MnmA [Sphingopyxis sp.]
MTPTMIETISSPAGLARADFQLASPLKDRRIVVAMSGGVDSSVVAALAA